MEILLHQTPPHLSTAKWISTAELLCMDFSYDFHTFTCTVNHHVIHFRPELDWLKALEVPDVGRRAAHVGRSIAAPPTHLDQRATKLAAKTK